MSRTARVEAPAAFGAPLAPPPDDLEQMMAIEAPIDDLQPIERSVEEQFAGTMARFTSPEAVRAGANHTQHVHSPMRTLYDAQGNDREVTHGDVPMLVGTGTLFIRCPMCAHLGDVLARDGVTVLSHSGFHAFRGPNGCPARPARQWMTCPICKAHGRMMVIFEGHAPSLTVPQTQRDENYVEPVFASAQDRTAQLQHKLENHMTAFHEGEAADGYGLRRRVTGR